MRSVQVTFDLPDAAAERRLLADYLVDAWPRIESRDCLDRAWYWRFGRASDRPPVELEDGTVLTGGGVVVTLTGDPTPDPVVAAERPRWDRLVADGPLDDWETTRFDPTFENARTKAVERFGSVGGDRLYRMRPHVARTTLSLFGEFDDDLPAVAESTEENPRGIGDWALIHFLLKQRGHDWGDEVDACRKAIANRLRSLAAFHGDAAARAELDRVVEDLTALRERYPADAT
jgi:hypothetical protein